MHNEIRERLDNAFKRVIDKNIYIQGEERSIIQHSPAFLQGFPIFFSAIGAAQKRSTIPLA